MALMKKKTLPILEELLKGSGTRMEIFDRCHDIPVSWEQFKRLWSQLRFQGMIETDDDTTCTHKLTAQGIFAADPDAEEPINGEWRKR